MNNLNELVVNLIVWGLTGLGAVLTFLRFIFGPTSADRLVAVDMMNTIIIGLIVLFSVATKNPLYMDIALLYALLAFIETIVFAKYLESKGGKRYGK